MIRRRRFANEQTGFAVIDADRDGDEIVLVGDARAPGGARARRVVQGVWQDDRALRPADQGRDRRAGRAVGRQGADRVPRARQAHRRRPGRAAARALRRRACSTRSTATRAAAFRVAGLNPRRTNEAIKSWNALRSTRALHLMLAPHGLAWLVPRIANEYGDRAHDVVRRRPYELTSVFGVGFQTADTIARAAWTPAGRARPRGASSTCWSRPSATGRRACPVGELPARAAALLGVRVAGRAARRDGGRRARSWSSEERWVYRPRDGGAGGRAGGARARAGRPPTPTLERRRAGGDLVPAPEQRAAVRGGVRLAAVDRHRRPGHRQDGDDQADLRRRQGAEGAASRSSRRPAAPRGGWPRRPGFDGLDHPLRARLGARPRSDRRTSSTTTCWSSTRPRWPTSSCWSRCCAPSASDMHVVLVGDADQLAPVGAGKPFAELVEAGAVPVAELTHIFRQAAGSMIVRGAHAVRQGEPPSFEAGDGLRRDLFLIEREDPRRRAGRDRLARRRAAARATTASTRWPTSRSSRPSTAARSGSTR